jgi:hypothetical protein
MTVVCHTMIELAVARLGARGLSSTAVQGLTQRQSHRAPAGSRLGGPAACFAHWLGPNIGHGQIRELPRSLRFTQEKEQVLVARVVVKGLVEVLDLGARTFEHLGKIAQE